MRARGVILATAAAIVLAADGCSSEHDQPTGDRARVEHASPPGWYWKNDADNDADERQRGPSKDDELTTLVAVRHGASVADRRSIEAKVRDYYAAAANADGARGCSLLQASIAAQVAAEQEQEGQSCAHTLSKLFEQWHAHLTREDSATMVFTSVHVDRNIGSVTLGFKAAPEAEIILQRESRAWKLAALFGSGLP